MHVEDRDTAFIQSTLPTLPGWLTDDAAYLTSALIRRQIENGNFTSVLEIGVYAGKYLSLLHHLTAQTNAGIVGIDTFQWFPFEGVQDHFRRVFGDTPRLTLYIGDSTRMTPQAITDLTESKPSFISVDGSHESKDVFCDLRCAREVLADGGIIAIDDLLNPRALGVSEGAFRFFLDPSNAGLAPFAFCGNKLFVASTADVKQFHQAVWEFAEANPQLSMSIEMKKLLGNGRQWVEQTLFGHPVLIF